MNPVLPARVDGHLPLRPIWLCRSCHRPWPCAAARLALRCEYGRDRVGLAVLMATHLLDALPELAALIPELDPKVAFERFLGWTPPHPLAGGSTGFT
ncbi:hypothetical protein V6U90_05860 [Micromonospora sp. CPCC 206060]|uniref:hypothetical protein n=1 Tax=Micromonospora sp. CPCC 206060 TaxID=3122406 RepID=UPI002FF3F0A2